MSGRLALCYRTTALLLNATHVVVSSQLSVMHACNIHDLTIRLLAGTMLEHARCLPMMQAAHGTVVDVAMGLRPRMRRQLLFPAHATAAGTWPPAGPRPHKLAQNACRQPLQHCARAPQAAISALVRAPRIAVPQSALPTSAADGKVVTSPGRCFPHLAQSILQPCLASCSGLGRHLCSATCTCALPQTSKSHSTALRFLLLAVSKHTGLGRRHCAWP